MATVEEIPAQTLKDMLQDGGELALLDLREEGRHSEGHLFYAASLPLSQLELRIHAMVPRFSTRIILMDDDDGLADRAGGVLRSFGYIHVQKLAGGVAGWEQAGFVLFSGVHVPSKAFGEFVEHRYDTPRIPAEHLKARLDAGEDIVILDSRPFDEYHNMNIPGGIDVPGAELAYRVHDLAPAPETTVIVNCAGRTRSIIGAQSLINAGIANAVMALKDGTMGWHLAGFDLEHGSTRQFADLTSSGSEKAQAVAAGVAQRFGVKQITKATLDEWRLQAAARSLYVLDVRTEAEFEQGRLPDAIHAPGGQLVQETETWVATLGARLVLVDNDGVRATMTASWLRQMGWDAVVLEPPTGADLTASGPVAKPDIHVPDGDRITPDALNTRLDDAEPPLVVDLRSSKTYRDGHIPGACFAVRARLGQSLAVQKTNTCVLISEDGLVAALAYQDLQQQGHPFAALHVLAGGMDAWRDRQLPEQMGDGTMLDQADDVWLKPYDHGQSVEDRMREYLAWEVDLVDRIERDGDHRFQYFPDTQT